MILVVLPTESQSYDLCDRKLEFEKGEPAGPFFGLEYALIAHALAEKFCGAPAKPMAPRFLKYVESHGCGPESAIYSDLKTSIERLETADLKLMAADGNPNLQLSPKDVQEWASAAAESFGGCPSLLAGHDKELP